MNWMIIAWAAIASGTIEEMLTHLWKVLVGQLHGPLSFRLILQPSVAVNPRDPRRIERYAGRSAPLFLDGSNGSGSSKRPLARRLEGCVQGFRRRRGPGDAICQFIVFAGSILAKRCWSRPS